MSSIGPFGVLEFGALVVSLIGLLPVIALQKESTKWFTLGYALLVVGMFATNVENVILPVTLNFTEHVIGVGVAGVVMFVAAYNRTKSSSGVEV